jgi:5-methylcytosine-specific restriction endonuclease McrA
MTMPVPRPINTVQPSPELRAMVLARDGHRCLFCGSTYRLELHHRPEADSLNYYPRPTEPRADDLVTFCHECHAILTAQVQMRPRHDARLARLDRTKSKAIDVERHTIDRSDTIRRTKQPRLDVDRSEKGWT